MKWEEIFKNYAVDTLEFIKTGKDLALTQGSLHLQELIKWEIYKSSALTVVFFVCLSACVYSFFIFRRVNKDYIGKHGYGHDGFLAGIITSIGLGLVFFSLATESSLDALKAYTVPRVVIMEKLERLIK